MGTRTENQIAIQICVRTAFWLVPKKALMRVDRETRPRMPMWYSLAGEDRKHAAISRRPSRYVNWAKAMHKNWSQQEKPRSRKSPPYRATHRRNSRSGRMAINCENTVRPRFMPHGRSPAVHVLDFQIAARSKPL